mgnify:CR=1 FL=1
MRSFLARRGLKAFSRRYDYDVSYMEHMLDVSPRAFMGFSRLSGLARHREAAPRDAIFAARLVGTRHEDCGPCLQLTADIARDSRMDGQQIRAVLSDDRAAMNEATLLGHRFARALVGQTDDLTSARDAVREAHGEKAVIDLTFAVQFSRMFPMVKAGLGYGQACQSVRVGETQVDLKPLHAVATA